MTDTPRASKRRKVSDIPQHEVHRIPPPISDQRSLRSSKHSTIHDISSKSTPRRNLRKELKDVASSAKTNASSSPADCQFHSKVSSVEKLSSTRSNGKDVALNAPDSPKRREITRGDDKLNNKKIVDEASTALSKSHRKEALEVRSSTAPCNEKYELPAQVAGICQESDTEMNGVEGAEIDQDPRHIASYALSPDQSDSESASTKMAKRRRRNRADHTGNASPTGLAFEQLESHDPLKEHAVKGKRGRRIDKTQDALSTAGVASEINTSDEIRPTTPIGDSNVLKWTIDSSSFEMFKNLTLNKLTGQKPITLVDRIEERAKVRQVLEQTVKAGEGNSILLIGARGTGKTALVNEVLLELELQHEEDFHVIRLNGFMQTDDNLALREIWRQLGREMDLDEEGQVKNNADTLSSLLALLSHPSELSTNQAPDQASKSVVFIMDEFDLFASHARQTLLYNLFDIAQSRKAPIAILGLSTRVDVAESLEKRVKSRFSHRQVYFSLPKSLDAFNQICRAALQVQPTDQALDNDPSDRALATTFSSTLIDLDSSIAQWNAYMETLLATPSIAQSLLYIYHTTKSIPSALTSLFLPIALLQPPTVPSTSLHNLSLRQPDSKLSILPHLPSLCLALLIAAARLDVILDSATCNFNMAYEQYVGLAAKARLDVSTARSAGGANAGSRIWSKQVARGAWEKLVDMRLLVPVTGGVGIGSEMMQCDVALEEIVRAVGEEMEVGMRKWCREI